MKVKPRFKDSGENVKKISVLVKDVFYVIKFPQTQGLYGQNKYCYIIELEPLVEKSPLTWSFTLHFLKYDCNLEMTVFYVIGVLRYLIDMDHGSADK